ncbi:MAG: KpsF/GutQ family sugar-phosphate isomerase [Candidatus Adiutrix sp.]
MTTPNLSILGNLSSPKIIAAAQKTLEQEANSLIHMANHLDESFPQAVRLLLNIKGRIAITGMGKSGHVAKKVAATFSSTGSPAYFIHPAEASHGDLGMISPKDAVIAYSNSGETDELTSILSFCARHEIPLIGVTKNCDSFLTRQSNVVLTIPNLPEACPIGCAPTTSTTAMMALGDALALCLLEAKGFTPESFHEYHPGGRLGRKLLMVRDIMHEVQNSPLVSLISPMSEVLFTITGKSFGCTGVQNDEGQLVGIITDGDLRRHMSSELLTLTAQDVMTKNPVTITPDTLALKALGLMQKSSITNIFVVHGDKIPAGILHIHDCLRAGLE